MPNEMLPMSTWTPRNGQTYEIVDKNARDRITAIEQGGGGGGGSGTVKSVNNVEPDTSGNVTLSIPSKTSDLQNDSGFLTQHQSLAAYRTSADQDTIDAAQNTAIAEKYTKPASGIPASDLADGVTPSDFPSIADITELWNSVSKRPAGAWEDFAWHQCPEAVRNYLANVDYDGVAYTESSIGDYAPTPAVPATNTKPIGQTVDGVTFYNIRPHGSAPYATANKSGTLNPLDQVRWIKSATNNMRDLGGWPCDGGTVKYGLLYRSGELNAQDEDLFIHQLGINTECDLTADGTPAYPGKMRFIGHTSYAMYSLANTEAWQVNLRGIFDAVRYGDPVVFHCSMGADRTGTLACILEGLLGVSQSDIDKDYELTSFYALRARNGNYQVGTTDWAHLIAQIEALSGDTFRDKVIGFVLGLGFTVDDINAYRHAMIDGTPEDITEPTQANLFDPNDSDVALRCRINSSGAAVAYADGQLVTGFIQASVGDVFRIETDKSLKTNGHTGMVGYYQSDKAYIHKTGQENEQVWTFSDSDLTGVCTILSSASGTDISSIGYVRFCIAYTDIGSIKIYKQ